MKTAITKPPLLPGYRRITTGRVRVGDRIWKYGEWVAASAGEVGMLAEYFTAVIRGAGR